MSGQVRFQVSKTGGESGQTGAEMDPVDLSGPRQQSYGSLPSSSLNNVQPSISVTGPDGRKKGLFSVFFLSILICESSAHQFYQLCTAHTTFSLFLNLVNFSQTKSLEFIFCFC